MLVGTALETLGVGLIVPAIALFTQPDFLDAYPWFRPALDALGNPGRATLIAGAMVSLCFIYLIKMIFLSYIVWRQARFAFGCQTQLSDRLFSIYLRQPYVFHLQRNSAQLIRNTVNEVNLFTFSILIPGLELLTEALVIVCICTLLVVVEPVGAVTAFLLFGLSASGFYYFARGYNARWGRERQHHEGLRIQHLQQGLGAAKDVKLLGRENEFLSQYAEHNSRTIRAIRLQFYLQQLPRLWLEVLAVASIAALVLMMLAQGREIGAILPMLGLFAAAAFRLMPSVSRVLSTVQSLRYGRAVVDLLHAEIALAVPAGNSAPGAMSSMVALELRRVTFAYLGAPAPALNVISLQVQRGESVGFIGASGAGKSTLVDLLLGLLAPDSGEVLVNGRDIHQSLRAWQDQIGYVPQTIYLTDDSLRCNVAFGLPKDQIDDAAVWRAVRAAQLEEFVRELPHGLDTVVGERGVRLSGGQRQRIGIARALYHDPGVLVLDEATSSLDTATEREVMQAVRALHGTKTILIVAHRISTVEHCDRIYRLEKGELAGTGTPQAMLLSAVGA
jgi:ABC-type multidrug transport system fused ATPase/permease subunit